MTCAHVVADALGQSALMHRTEAPTDPVEVMFGVEGARRASPILGRVVPDGWRRSPPSGEAAAGPIDIAVLRLDLNTRPAGADYARFVDRVQPGNMVIAHGPHMPSDLAPDARSHWVDGEVREQARLNEIEFLTAAAIDTNIIVGGFSGGPLTITATGEIAGMVRAVLEGHYRRAYALPVDMLAEVWPTLRQQMGRKGGAIAPIFDLIDRKKQVQTLTTETQSCLQARQGGGAAPAMVFTVVGPPDEDHTHLRRRAQVEIARHRLRGDRGAITVADIVLRLPEGIDQDDRLSQMSEDLEKKTKAAGMQAPDLRAAFEKGAEGWVVHVMIDPDLSDDDAALLTAFLAQWDRIADGAACELYLVLSFVHAPTAAAGPAAARWHADLLAGRSAVCLPPLSPVIKGDIIAWQEEIAKQEHLGDEGLAEALAFRVEEAFNAAPHLPMRQLRQAILRAGIDPENP